MSDGDQQQTEQSGGERGSRMSGILRGGPKATLEKLGDITISGRFAINLRILLEPIGFLRFITVFLCLLAFSLTAGFGSNGSSNQASCDSANNITNTITLTWSYPYRTNSFRMSYNPAINSTAPISCTSATDFKTFSSSAEYYVFMSTVTFLYGIIALASYVLLYVPRYDISKYLSVVDLIGTCVLIFFFFFAGIAWIAGYSQLQDYTRNLLSSRISDTSCVLCDRNNTIPPPATQTFAQPSVSLLFGWVAIIVMIATIWFIYKDTIIHLNRMGPLYQLSFVRKRFHQRREGEGGEEGGQEGERGSPSPEVGMQDIERQESEDKW